MYTLEMHFKVCSDLQFYYNTTYTRVDNIINIMRKNMLIKRL